MIDQVNLDLYSIRICMYNIKANDAIDRIKDITKDIPTKKEMNDLNEVRETIISVLKNNCNINMEDMDEYLSNVDKKIKCSSDLELMRRKIKNAGSD